MRLNRLLALVTIAGSLWATSTVAQIPETQPAEFPPASYKGKQYVDSKGCVFIRAGIDGNVSWVPRVSRSRKVVCGFKPSLSGQVASAPAAAPAADKPVQITINNTAAAPAPTPAPKPRRAAAPRKVAPAPVVVRQTAPRRVAAAPAPKPAPVVKKVAAPVQPAARTASACPGASAISQRYLRGGSGLTVRCGPQTAPIVSVAPARVAAASPQPSIVAPAPAPVSRRTYAAAPVATAAPVTSTTRIVPKHVAINRINTRNVAVPHGYKPVWEDDRLNPNRAEQNLQGRADMLLIWTQTVPRRLIDRRTGRDVTASVPLVYPYLDVAMQSRELGQVTIVQRDGKVMKRIVRRPGSTAVVSAPTPRKPVYSSRSAPRKQAAPAPQRAQPAVAGKRYVQIGTYRDQGNAQRAARQVARMGMPARIGTHRRGGKTYMTVQAGPFNGSNAMSRALQRLRGAGYRDAFPRN